MANWWSVVFLATAAVAYYAHDSIESLSPEDEVDNGVNVVNTRTNSLYPPQGSSCRTWCSCAGQYGRNSYCCPTGIPSDSICGSRPTTYGVINSPVMQSGGPDGWPVDCRSSYCEPSRPIAVRRPVNWCPSSRLCSVLVNPPAVPHTPVNAPTSSTPCTSHADCGEDVCCSNVCTSIEACARLRQVPRNPPRVFYGPGFNGMCTSDIDCTSSYGSHYICCENQCKTRSTCIPRVFTDDAAYY